MLAVTLIWHFAAVPSCTSYPERCIPLSTLTGTALMPVVALGTWRGSYKECIGNDYACVRAKAKASVMSWVDVKGDHVDTANNYRTQLEVGEALAEKSVKRDDIFITTKCPGPMGLTATIQCAEDNLQMLGLYGVNTTGYLDLLLIHYPNVVKPECYGPSSDPDIQKECGNAASSMYDPGTAARQETWKAMELLQKLGRVKSIGFSNYNSTHIAETLAVATVPIALHQVEWNPLDHDEDMLALCTKHGIQLQAWSPLGGDHGDILSNPQVVAIAATHNTSTAQVVLKWSLQRGVAVVTGTDNPAHMASDLDLWSFTLTDQEMTELNNLKP